MSESPIEQMMTDWHELRPPPFPRDNLPYATHEGVLRVGEITLRCYQLSTGQRVIDGDDVDQFFGFQPEAQAEP